MRKFAYSAPQSLSDALAVFQEHGEGGRALAGGKEGCGTGDCGVISARGGTT